jgi:hypothetical protein
MAGTDELSREGYQRIYTTESYEVVPKDFILGKLPIMPDFGTPTIPHTLGRLKNDYFMLGKADSAIGKQDGSNIFYINHFAMTWSRSKLCMNG